MGEISTREEALDYIKNSLNINLPEKGNFIEQ